MTCARTGCVEPAKRRFCSDRCATTDRQRRLRERDRQAAQRESAPVERVEFRGLEVAVRIDVTAEPTAFGVECDEVVAWIFHDDQRRFANRRA